MRTLYTAIFRLAIPFILIRLLWRSRLAPAYRRRLRERFAWFEPPKVTGGIWLHAVSLGESVAAIPLIKAIKAKYPDLPVTVTNMTPTGSERIKATFGDDILNLYLPYDLPGILKRFLRKVNPVLVVIMETELWPNLLNTLKKNKIPLLLANGRLSTRSATGYLRIKKMVRTMLSAFSWLAVQSDADAQRFLSLGASPEKVVVTGSIKFDIQLPGDLQDKAQGLRRILGEDRLLWIAASTHEGEEEQILDAFQKVRRSFPNLLLFLVPRHPERFTKVTQLCKKRHFTVSLRSDNQPCKKNTDIFIGDTMGEMMLFYAVSDLAFVGGSLVPVGGHNLLEPAALGKASITGHYMHNFVKITELFLEANAVKRVNDRDELAQTVIDLLSDKALREQMGQSGQRVVAHNRGALAKHLELIDGLLSLHTVDH